MDTQSDCKKLTEEVKILKTRLKICVDENTSLKLEKDEKTTSLAQTTKLLAQSKTLASNYRENFHALNGEVEILERDKQALNEEVAELKAQITSLQAATKV